MYRKYRNSCVCQPNAHLISSESSPQPDMDNIVINKQLCHKLELSTPPTSLSQNVYHILCDCAINHGTDEHSRGEDDDGVSSACFYGLTHKGYLDWQSIQHTLLGIYKCHVSDCVSWLS